MAQAGIRRQIGPRRRHRLNAGETDAKLAFMLARQGMTRWQFDAERFDAAADGRTSGREHTMMQLEAELGMQQISALRIRIEPFGRMRDMEIRFEAQEVMAALDAVHVRISRAQQRLRRLQANAPWRDALQVAQLLTARLR